MKKFLFIAAFIISGFHVSTSSACGCGRRLDLDLTLLESFKAIPLEKYVGMPSNYSIGPYDFFYDYGYVLTAHFPQDKTAIEDLNLIKVYEDLKTAIGNLSVYNDQFPKVEKIGTVIIARAYNCKIKTEAGECLVTGVVAYDTVTEAMSGCLAILNPKGTDHPYKRKDYFHLINGSLEIFKDENHPPYHACGSAQVTAEQALKRLEQVLSHH